MEIILKHLSLKALPAAIALLLSAGATLADDEGFHGYFRVGAGTSTSGSRGPQSCYGLGGNTMKYRLGNECDAYAEFGYTKDIAKVDGVSYRLTAGDTLHFDSHKPHRGRNIGPDTAIELWVGTMQLFPE